jgi:hypothetical protein
MKIQAIENLALGHLVVNLMANYLSIATILFVEFFKPYQVKNSELFPLLSVHCNIHIHQEGFSIKGA